MIRKILAFLLTTAFVVIIPILIVTQSLIYGFLSESTLSQKIIPKAYGPIMDFLAMRLDPQNKKIIQGELQTIVRQETFQELMMLPISSFFRKLQEPAGPISIDLRPMRDKLRVTLAASSKTVNFGQIITEQIPNQVVIQNQYTQPIRMLVKGKQYLLVATATLGVILLSIIGLLIMRPWSSICKAIGKPMLVSALCIGFFVFAIRALISIPSRFAFFNNAVTPSQLEFLETIGNIPTPSLLTATIILGSAGIVLLLLGYFLRKPA